MKSLGQRLIFLMERKDMKQTELASKLGISKQSLYKYIHDLCEPRSEIILHLAVVLETSADYIVGLTEDFTPKTLNKEKENQFELFFKYESLSLENKIRIEERIDFLLETQQI